MFIKASTWKCSQCTGVFNVIDHLYEQHYTGHYFQHNYESLFEQQYDKFKCYAEILRKYVSTGPILDYGCGTGVFLKVMANHDLIPAFGLDTSPAARSIAKKKLGNTCTIIESIDDVPCEKKFTCISFIDSFAHIPNIRVVFQTVQQRLEKKRGIILIKTPLFTEEHILYLKALSFVVPQSIAQSLFHIPLRYLLCTQKSVLSFLASAGIEILHIRKEPDYTRNIVQHSFLSDMRAILTRKIPRIFNPHNCLLVIGRTCV